MSMNAIDDPRIVAMSANRLARGEREASTLRS
jgi:hypothetical protein